MSYKSRSYKLSDIKRLFAYSGNQCAEPNCKNSIVSSDGKVVLGEICHIAAASSDGPRYNSEMNDEHRRSYDNLLLLCSIHHKLIDNKENIHKYPTSLLKDWKFRHELKYMNSGFVVSDGITEEAIKSIVEENYKKVANSVLDLFKVFKNQFFLYFTQPYSFFRINKIRYFEASIFIVLSVLLTSILDYPLMSSTSVMVREGELWTILLETEVDREFFKSSGFMLGLMEFFRELLGLLILGVVFTMLVRVFKPSIYKGSKFIRILKNSIVAFCIYNLGISMITCVTYLCSGSEYVSNYAFLIIYLLFGASFILLLVFLFLGIKYFLNISFLKTSSILVLTLIITILGQFSLEIFLFDNIIYSGENSKYETANDLNTLAMEEFEIGNYDQAIEYSTQALISSPKNLLSDLIIVQAKVHNVLDHHSHIDDFMLGNDSFSTSDSELLRQDIGLMMDNYNDLEESLIQMAAKYNEIPSVHLFKAQIHGYFNMCDDIIKEAIVVYNHEESNPVEKVEAAFMLRYLTMDRSINIKYLDFIDNSIWFYYDDSFFNNLALTLRLFYYRSQDNLTLLLEGYDYQTIINVLKPKEVKYAFELDNSKVPYLCDSATNFELEVHRKLSRISNVE